MWQAAGVSLLLDRVQNLRIGEEPCRLNHVHQVIQFHERQSDKMSGDLGPIWRLTDIQFQIK